MRTHAALLVAAAGLFSLGSAVASAESNPSIAQEAATGTVTALDLSHVAIGKMSCLLRSGRVDSEAQEFAVGERVTIDCLRGLLKAIALAPITGPRHSDTYVYVPVTKSAASSASGASTGAGGASTQNAPGSGNKITINWNFAVFGPQPTLTGSFSVTGAITDLEQNSITVGDDTCPLGAATGNLLSERLQIGETASMSCTLYSNGVSSGALSAVPS